MKDQERVPLRVVLRNFLNHIENLESQSCPENSYEAEFQDLKIFSENVKTLKEYSCMEGEKEVNRKKNRYKDILPFDVSRVVLNEYAGIPGSDYINANFIKGASGSPAYIASQGPLPSTVNDFWRMVVQCEVQVIVMACNEEEAGKAKCEKYWVDDGEEKQFGMISVKLLKSSTVCPDFSVRTMRLKYTNSQSVLEERTVCQLHYVAWPDHGVPTVVQPLLDMVRLVRDTQASETLPVLVHCSAGCGRTGTICAIDYVWGLLRTGKLTSDFSLLSLIRDMRKQRIAMVQTKEQYVLVHQAVRELFKEQLCMIDSHPYENVDPNGVLMMKEEENTYDCIEYKSNNNSEEKLDNKEKEIIPPPLPSKRNVPKFASKYEKDVENLSAQQRSLNYASNVRRFVPVYPVTEKKKVNNKEYDNNFEKISVKVFDNGVKPDVNKPIPSKGILRVPQLETLAPKCTGNIKRSKSLKVVSNCDKNSLSFRHNSPTESKRRSSLESNFDEHALISTNSEHSKSKVEVVSASDQKKKTVSQLVSKYDILKNQDHRTFVRSLTSLDMRQKLISSNSNSAASSLDNSIERHKCKLLRSNTQINILKRGNTTFSHSKNTIHPSTITDSINNLQIDSPSNNHSKVGSNRILHNSSAEHLVDYSIKFKSKGLSSSTPSKHSNFIKSPPSKELLSKTTERIKNSPSFQKIESIRHLKESTRARSSSNSRIEPTNHIKFEETYDSYAEKSGKLNPKRDKFVSSGLKVLPSNPRVENVEVLSLPFEESKYVRSNQLKLVKAQKKSLVNKPALTPPKKDLSIQGCSKDMYSSSRPYREELPAPINLNSGNDEYHATSDEYCTFNEIKSSPSFSDHFVEANEVETSNSWLERDRTQPSFIKSHFNPGYVVSRPRGQTTLANTSDDSKEIQKRIDTEVDDCRNLNITGMVDHFEQLNGHDLNNTYDVLFRKDYMQPSEIKYHLQNRKNIHQYNSALHTSRHTNVPNVCPEASNAYVNRTPSKTIVPQQRVVDAPSFSQDGTYFSSEFPRKYRGNDCFHSAPGVDLDQVAASITKNDENLMKATLEELQVRKTKLQMVPKERCPPKGLPSLPSNGDKKRQQQYL